MSDTNQQTHVKDLKLNITNIPLETHAINARPKVADILEEVCNTLYVFQGQDHYNCRYTNISDAYVETVMSSF